jgi:hypothetical protein
MPGSVAISCAALVAACALASPLASRPLGEPPASAPDTLSLRVGQAIDYTPGFLPAQVICNDVSIIRVEDAGTPFRLTGLRAGDTDCGFWSIALRGIRRVVHVRVRER